MQAATRQDPLVNSVLLGTYRFERLLGRGGMGSVYAATHVHLQTACAIKVLLREFTDHPDSLKRFQREAQITSQLGHPNIVRVTDFNFTEDGAPFMVMELLRGDTLLKRLKDGAALGQKGLSLADAVLLFGPLCDALGLAHEKGVIHRDLKPENIFLPADTGLGGAKILDFGISKMRDSTTRLTQADASMGTQSYMAPEIVCGAASEADVRSDVFSLGALLYEALTGQMAYDGPNAMAVMYKLVYQPPPSARAVLPELPEEIDAVLLSAMAKKPEDRIQSAPELFARFFAAAQAYLPPPTEMTEEAGSPYRFTNAALRAVRQSGVHTITPGITTGNHAVVQGRLPTGPQGRIPTDPRIPKVSPAAPSLPPMTGEMPDEGSERRRNGGGGVLTGVIVALVLVTVGGLFLLRERLLPPSAKTVAAPKVPPAIVPKAPPEAPVAPPRVDPPKVDPPKVDSPKVDPPVAAVSDTQEPDVSSDTDKKKKRKRRNSGEPRTLPRLGLPQPEE